MMKERFVSDTTVPCDPAFSTDRDPPHKRAHAEGESVFEKMGIRFATQFHLSAGSKAQVQMEFAYCAEIWSES